MRTIHARFLLMGAIIALLGNWSADQTSQEGESGKKKNRINFYGILHTRNGEIYSVENISIGYMYKQIPVYEKPKGNEATLQMDPKSGIISKLDLSEIEEIQVPQPYMIMHYQRPEGTSKMGYIAIKVNQRGQINYYIIDTYRKLMCDQITPSGPIEKEVPFQSLDRITIQGSRERIEQKKEEAAKKTACGCDK